MVSPTCFLAWTAIASWVATFTPSTATTLSPSRIPANAAALSGAIVSTAHWVSDILPTKTNEAPISSSARMKCMVDPATATPMRAQ